MFLGTRTNHNFGFGNGGFHNFSVGCSGHQSLEIILTCWATIKGCRRAKGATRWEFDFQAYFRKEIVNDNLVDLLLGKVAIMGKVFGKGV